ncbi:hypothetical protein MMC11_007176 [Xylographa trunciseda]|nr:hypothetical protein [Xylographa trunciseda]
MDTGPVFTQSGSHIEKDRALPYIPKLSYRNSAPCPSSPGSGDSLSTASTIKSSVAIASSSTQPEYNTSPRSLHLPSGPINGTNPASNNSTPMPLSLPKAASPVKKKRSSVFSFFTVKEPSTQAWLDFQENLRKQQPTRHGRVTAVGLPMVSSAKLPPTVPKVNSRWDGVPDSVIQREKEKKSKHNSSHLHVKQLSSTLSGGRSMSRSSSRSSGSGSRLRRTQGSILGYDAPPMSSSSAASSRTDLPWTPSSADARDFSSIFEKSMHSGPETPLSEISSFAPNIPEPVVSYEEPYKRHPSSSVNITDPPKFSASLASGAGEAAPSTPHFNPYFPPPTPRDPDSSTNVHHSQIQTTVLTLPPRQEQVILHSVGPNILGPPMSARRKLKGEAQELQMPETQASSILKRNATLRKTPNLARPAISDYFPGQNRSVPDSGVDLNTPQDVPWSSPTSVSTSMERGDTERSLTPTPQASKASFRKSKLPFFRS